MKRSVLLVPLALGGIACSVQDLTVPVERPQASVSAAGFVQHVVGGGTVVREDLPGMPREVHAFSVQLAEDGSVRGQAAAQLAAGDVSVDVQCLTIRANRAWLSGVVLRSSDPELPSGSAVVWRVEDNGQGAWATPDRISDFVAATGPTVCNTWPTPAFHPLNNGGVRIFATGGPSLSEIVGTWDAVVYVYGNPANAEQSWDPLAEGVQARLVIPPNGRYREIWTQPGGEEDVNSGSIDVVAGRYEIRMDGAPFVIVPELMKAAGSKLNMVLDVPASRDWNGDGEQDDSHIVIEWRKAR